MANPSKQKGTRAETRVVKYLQGHGIAASRRALHGSKDLGDIQYQGPRMYEPMIMEVKAGKQTANPSRAQLETWLDQAWVEGRNSGMECVLVVVRYNRRIKDADVWFQYHDGDGYFTRAHAFLEEYVEEMATGSRR